jgi:hypothetical protein
MTDRLVEQLDAEARYKRERLALYRAKVNTGQPTTAIRLRELERASDYADRSLRAAKRAAPIEGPR